MLKSRKFLAITLLVSVLVMVAAVPIAYGWGSYVGDEDFPTTCIFGKEVAIFDVQNVDTQNWTVHAHFFGPGGGDTGNYTILPGATKRIKWSSSLNITTGTVDATPQSGTLPQVVATYNYCQS